MSPRRRLLGSVEEQIDLCELSTFSYSKIKGASEVVTEWNFCLFNFLCPLLYLLKGWKRVHPRILSLSLSESKVALLRKMFQYYRRRRKDEPKEIGFWTLVTLFQSMVEGSKERKPKIACNEGIK